MGCITSTFWNLRVRAFDRRAAGQADTPRQHPRDERRQLSPRPEPCSQGPGRGRSPTINTGLRGPKHPGTRHPQSERACRGYHPITTAKCVNGGENALVRLPSRTLRAATRGPSGLLDRRCARRLKTAGRDEEAVRPGQTKKRFYDRKKALTGRYPAAMWPGFPPPLTPPGPTYG